MKRSPDSSRKYSAVDRAIGRLDRCLRAVAPQNSAHVRPSPADNLPEPALVAHERRHSAGLMRVNHTGEVCAQALYLGQALAAGNSELSDFLSAAAAEENDHLYWCAARLAELETRPSLLNPAWFIASLGVAVAVGLVSDTLSLSFVEETERQVCAHLDGHLGELSAKDVRSRAIVEAMRLDEARHAENARIRGAHDMQPGLKRLMALQARIMTRTAYWV